MQIEIRHAQPDDYLALHRVFSQPRAAWGTLQMPYSSPEKWRERAAKPEEGGFSLVACVDGEVVGQLGLFINHGLRRRHTASLGMGVHDAYQGQGVGTALMTAAVDLADNWLNVIRLELSVWCDNIPAVRLYKRFDFEIEGTLRDYGFREGRYVDAYSMARLRADRRQPQG